MATAAHHHRPQDHQAVPQAPPPPAHHQMPANHQAAAAPPVAHETQAPQGKTTPTASQTKTNRPPSSSSSASRGYGGGAYYGGGSSTAYRSGSRSPLGLAPYALGGAALGFGLYGAYAYNYDHPYGFHNRTSNQNETLPIECLCAKYSACGCDDNNNSTFLNSIIGNGSASDENSTLVHVGIVNGTKTIIINGTLPNGTDTSANSTGSSSGAAGRQVAELSGYWVMGAVVGATVWLL